MKCKCGVVMTEIECETSITCFKCMTDDKCAMCQHLRTQIVDLKTDIQIYKNYVAYINKEVCGTSLIIADSAEPRLIKELRNHKNNIRGADKGKGSISLGIALLQDYELIIEHESSNMAKELNNFVYADKSSNLYVDAFNHLIDPLRYVATYHLGNNRRIEIR